MSYYPRGYHHVDDDVDDFDEYDPTPYGGGYDISLTYGRPLSPSEDTCYPNTSSSSDDFDYDRPQYSSYAEPSAYGDEALENEYKSYVRPNRPPPPSYAVPPNQGYGGGHDRPQPNYGFQPGAESGGFGQPEFGSSPDYGSGYGRRPEYGSDYGRRPEYERPGFKYGSGHGRKSEYEDPTTEYGSGYGRKSEYEEEPSSEYGSGYRRRPEMEEPGSEYGSGFGRKPAYGEEEGGGYEYDGRPERTEFEAPGSGGYRPIYGRPTNYEGEEGGEYGRPSYGRPSYGQPEEGEFRRPTYERRDDDDQGYGRKKYVSSSSPFAPCCTHLHDTKDFLSCSA